MKLTHNDKVIQDDSPQPLIQPQAKQEPKVEAIVPLDVQAELAFCEANQLVYNFQSEPGIQIEGGLGAIVRCNILDGTNGSRVGFGRGADQTRAMKNALRDVM